MDPYCTSPLTIDELRLLLGADAVSQLVRQEQQDTPRAEALDGQTVRWARWHDVRLCPFCHTAIEKHGGCSQMRCTRCGGAFNWDAASRLVAPPWWREAASRACDAWTRARRRYRSLVRRHAWIQFAIGFLYAAAALSVTWAVALALWRARGVLISTCEVCVLCDAAAASADLAWTAGRRAGAWRRAVLVRLVELSPGEPVCDALRASPSLPLHAAHRELHGRTTSLALRAVCGWPRLSTLLRRIVAEAAGCECCLPWRPFQPSRDWRPSLESGGRGPARPFLCGLQRCRGSDITQVALHLLAASSVTGAGPLSALLLVPPALLPLAASVEVSLRVGLTKLSDGAAGGAGRSRSKDRPTLLLLGLPLGLPSTPPTGRTPPPTTAATNAPPASPADDSSLPVALQRVYARSAAVEEGSAEVRAARDVTAIRRDELATCGPVWMVAGVV